MTDKSWRPDTNKLEDQQLAAHPQSLDDDDRSITGERDYSDPGRTYSRKYDIPTPDASPNVPRDLDILGSQTDSDVTDLNSRTHAAANRVDTNTDNIHTTADIAQNHRAQEGVDQMGGTGEPTHSVSSGTTKETLKKHPHSHDGLYATPHPHPYALDTHDHNEVYAPAAHGHGEFGNYVPLSGTWGMRGDIASNNGGFGLITNNGNPIVGFKQNTGAGMTYMEGCYQGWYNRLVFKWVGSDGSINSGTWIYAGSFYGSAYYKSDLDAKVKDKADQTKAVDVSKVDVTKLDVHETLSFDINSLKAAGIPVETHEYKYSHEDNPTKTLPEVEQTDHSYSVNQVLAAAILHIKKLEKRVAELEK